MMNMPPFVPPLNLDQPMTPPQTPEALQRDLSFAEQIKEARERLKLPKDATAWRVMCANADAERADKDFFRSIFGL